MMILQNIISRWIFTDEFYVFIENCLTKKDVIISHRNIQLGT